MFPLALFSFVLLAFEVFITKLLAYSLHAILIYVVLGIAMLGLGAAGTLVSLNQRWLAPDVRDRALAWSGLAFVIVLVVSLAVFVRVTPVALGTDQVTFFVSLLLAIPFLAAGTVITLALSSGGDRVGRYYATNLVGSGLGCFLPLVLLGPLSGERFIGLLAVIGWASAALYVWGVQRRSRALLSTTLGTFIVAAASLAFAPVLFEALPEPGPLGQVDYIRQRADAVGITGERLYDRWNPTGRIEIYEYDNVPELEGPFPVRFYAQDSNNGSILIQWDGVDRDGAAPTDTDPSSNVARLCSETLYSQGYFRQRDKVLVVGLGGAPDVQCALYNQAQSVDVVEINEDSIAAVTGPFSDYLGGVGKDPRVSFYERDGRSFAHGAKGRGYDLIQLSGVDTKQGLASGALALAENHLYTREAFEDYLQALAPSGVIAITRFGDIEAVRLANTAMEVLRELGEERPEDHVVVLKNGVLVGVLVARTPFSREDVARLREQFEKPDLRRDFGVAIFFYEWHGFPLRERPTIAYSPFDELASPHPDSIPAVFAAARAGKSREYEAASPWDVTATDDDHPFFFDVFRYDTSKAWGYDHVKILLVLLGSLLFFSVLLIVAPIWSLRRGMSSSSKRLAPIFFGSIGFAFLLVEVWMLHRFAMYLGHQTYSMSVVLATLLVASGVGAWFGERTWPNTRTRVVIGVFCIVALVIVGLAVLPSVQNATWSTSVFVRAAVTMAYIAPIGFFMGFPFPAGLRWMNEVAPTAVPWSIGINAFASVLSTTAVIPLSLFLGYQVVVFIGVALYGVALVAALGMGSRQAA